MRRHSRLAATLLLGNLILLAGGGVALADSHHAARTAALRPLALAPLPGAAAAPAAVSTGLEPLPQSRRVPAVRPSHRAGLPALPSVPSVEHAVAPTALVIPAAAAPPARVRALARTTHNVTVVLAGTVGLAGKATSLLGVSATSFRWFTPGPTLRSNPLWSAVERGELAVSYALAAQRHLRLNQLVTVGRRRMRIGAEADFGLSQAAIVVSDTVGAALGAHTEELIVGKTSADAVAQAVGPLLGRSTVVNLAPPPPPAPSATDERPTTWHQLYIDAASTCPGLSWTVLAAIGQVESDDGYNDGPSSAGALGPMQFEPATWAEYGYDPFGSAPANIMDPIDAVYSAARMLCSDGAAEGPVGLAAAVFDYNHATWYVKEVLALAVQYGNLYG